MDQGKDWILNWARVGREDQEHWEFWLKWRGRVQEGTGHSRPSPQKREVKQETKEGILRWQLVVHPIRQSSTVITANAGYLENSVKGVKLNGEEKASDNPWEFWNAQEADGGAAQQRGAW